MKKFFGKLEAVLLTAAMLCMAVPGLPAAAAEETEEMTEVEQTETAATEEAASEEESIAEEEITTAETAAEELSDSDAENSTEEATIAEIAATEEKTAAEDASTEETAAEEASAEEEETTAEDASTEETAAEEASAAEEEETTVEDASTEETETPAEEESTAAEENAAEAVSEEAAEETTEETVPVEDAASEAVTTSEAEETAAQEDTAETEEITEITEAEEEEDTEEEVPTALSERSLQAVCGGVTFTLTGELPADVTFEVQNADTDAAQERILAASEDEISVTAAYELDLLEQGEPYTPESPAAVTISGQSKDQMLYVLTDDGMEEQGNALSITMKSYSCILAYAKPDIPTETTEDYESGTTASYTAPVTVTFHQTEARSMLSDINTFRTDGNAWYWNSDDTTKTTGVKVNALQYDYDLEKAAMQRAAEICFYYSHTRPNGASCFTAYDSAHSSYCGENIAAGYRSADSVFTGWKEENQNYKGQGHRRNMLNSNFHAVGIACAEVNGTRFWVQEFSYSYVASADSGACDTDQSMTLEIADDNVDTAYLTIDNEVLESGETTISQGKSYTAGMAVRLTEDFGSSYIQLPDSYLTLTPGNTAVLAASGSTVTGRSVGTTDLTVTTTQSRTATASITVGPRVTGLTLNEDSDVVAIGNYVRLTATISPSNAGDQRVTWSSSDSSVATVSNGYVKGISSGTAVITAKSVDGGYTDSCTFRVGPSVTSITAESLTLNVGATNKISITVEPANAVYSATYSSLGSRLFSVDESGNVTGKKAGTGSVYIHYTSGSTIGYLYCSVTVLQPVTGVSLNESTMSMTVGGTGTLQATITPSDASNQKVTWASSNTDVATVDGSGSITAKAAGSAVITVTTEDGGKTASCTVTVEEATQVMYRLYNTNSGEHFYTANASERDYLVSLGWNDEDIGWIAPATSNTPVYRLYNANGGEHHYTTNAAEKEMLVANGWSYEGIGWYSDDQQRVPLYRQYNPNAYANNHNYTYSAGERDHLIGLGWHDEGIGWYGVAEK